MLLNYRLSTEAEIDINEAYSWYESQKPGLGDEFLIALDLARDSIRTNPSTYKVLFKKRVRVYQVPRFPFQVFYIFYILERKEINVISVFHTSRNPKTLKKRAS